MWALIVDGKINRVFKVPTAFKHPTTGIQYPRNWLNLATDSEKSAIGLIEITVSGTYKDSDYYINSESNPVYDASKGTVTITKSSSARNVAELQTSFKESITQKAWVNIGETDWYVTRKSEKSTAIPSSITTHRDSVRTKQAEQETAITNAADTAALEALYTRNSSGVRPLGDLPTLE